jgi:hypothetical protein
MSALVFAGCASKDPGYPRQPPAVQNSVWGGSPVEMTLGDWKSDAGEDCAESGHRNACACEWAWRGTKVPSEPEGKDWCDFPKEEDSQ